MASREQYIEELRQLEQRFLRVAQHGSGDRDLDAASAVGGQIVWQATVDGLLPVKLPEPDFSQCSSDRSPIYRITWITAAAVYSDTNPLAFRSERRSSPDAAWIEVGRTSTDDWRIRAENYAQLCREYVHLLSEDRPPELPPAPKRPATCNEVMLAILHSNPEAWGWKLKDWESETGFSKSTIHDTPAWKMVGDIAKEEKARRAMDRQRRPRKN